MFRFFRPYMNVYMVGVFLFYIWFSLIKWLLV
jgi:hypothetical protein